MTDADTHTRVGPIVESVLEGDAPAPPRWYEYFELFRGNLPEPMPFGCEPIVDSGLGRLIAMEA